MLAWILLIVSVLGLSYIFLHRLVLTRRDMAFQKHLNEEEDTEKSITLEPVEEEIDEKKKSASSGTLRKKYLKADMHFSRGEHEEAEQLLKEVLEANESHLDANLKLGLLYMKDEDFPQAELYFSRLVNLKKDPIFFSNLGAALYKQQRLLEAAEAYENAIAMDDKRAARLQSLAQVYHELNDSEKALKYFELAARRKPKDNELKFILADYYRNLERYEDAIEVLNRILDTDPYNKEVKALIKELESNLG